VNLDKQVQGNRGRRFIVLRPAPFLIPEFAGLSRTGEERKGFYAQ